MLLSPWSAGFPDLPFLLKHSPESGRLVYLGLSGQRRTKCRVGLELVYACSGYGPACLCWGPGFMFRRRADLDSVGEAKFLCLLYFKKLTN